MKNKEGEGAWLRCSVNRTFTHVQEARAVIVALRWVCDWARVMLIKKENNEPLTALVMSAECQFPQHEPKQRVEPL